MFVIFGLVDEESPMTIGEVPAGSPAAASPQARLVAVAQAEQAGRADRRDAPPHHRVEKRAERCLT
jgi:hypothetical protein